MRTRNIVLAVVGGVVATATGLYAAAVHGAFDDVPMVPRFGDDRGEHDDDEELGKVEE